MSNYKHLTLYKHLKILFLLGLMGGCFAGPALSADLSLPDVSFPIDAKVVDVTSFGAIPDDGIDDTAALQAALDSAPSGNHVFFFPEGEYRVSAKLLVAMDDGVTKRNILQGASQQSVVIKLDDNLGHADAVIDFRSGPAQFFRNAVRDLTVDIGTGNPAASGIKFNASNQGTVRNVTIISRDEGNIGLDLSHSGEIGPLLIKNVTINGFATGLRTRWQTASQTVEDLHLSNQSVVGWQNMSTQTVFGRKVFSYNSVPAIINSSEGRMVIIDSLLEGYGGASATAAIRNQKSLYARNISTSGYAVAISNELANYRGNQSVLGPTVVEYWANGSQIGRRGGMFTLFPSPNTGLHLPIKDHPEKPYADHSSWSGPHLFGAFPDDALDDSVAIQAAIDSGASTIYLPRGTWIMAQTVVIGSQTERFMGTEAILTGNGTLRIEGSSSTPLFIERLQSGGIEYLHDSDRDLVMEHMLGATYTRGEQAEVGDLFLSDINMGPLNIRDQSVWARQLNIETNTELLPDVEAKILNDGADLWILGYKTENAGTLIKTVRGGRTELLGALHVGGFGAEPAFVTEDAAFFAAVAKGSGTVVETRDGTTLSGILEENDAYAAFPQSLIADEVVIVDNTDPEVSTTGTWTSSNAYPAGYIGRNFLFSDVPGSTVSFAPNFSRPGYYQVFARWLDSRSGQDHTGHASNAPFSIQHLEGTFTTTLDQGSYGGQWVSMGTFPFSDTGEAMVTLSTDGADRKVIADAVRFEWVADLPPSATVYAVGDGYTFATIQSAIDAIPEDLGGQGEQRIVIHRKEGQAPWIYSEALVIDDFRNASEEDFIHITVAESDRHNGTPNSGVKLQCFDNVEFAVGIRQEYLQISWLEIEAAPSLPVIKVWGRYSHGTVLSDLLISGGRSGIVAGFNNYKNHLITIRNCHLQNLTGEGIRKSVGGSIAIIDCTLRDIVGHGIHLRDGGDLWQIHNTSVSRTGGQNLFTWNVGKAVLDFADNQSDDGTLW